MARARHSAGPSRSQHDGPSARTWHQTQSFPARVPHCNPVHVKYPKPFPILPCHLYEKHERLFRRARNYKTLVRESVATGPC